MVKLRLDKQNEDIYLYIIKLGKKNSCLLHTNDVPHNTRNKIDKRLRILLAVMYLYSNANIRMHICNMFYYDYVKNKKTYKGKI